MKKKSILAYTFYPNHSSIGPTGCCFRGIWTVWRLSGNGCAVWGEFLILSYAQRNLSINNPFSSKLTTFHLFTSQSFHIVLSKADLPDLYVFVPFQYVTLFASAFPLAAAVSILFLFIEGRADLFKLLYVYQRPKVRRYHWSVFFVE